MTPQYGLIIGSWASIGRKTQEELVTLKQYWLLVGMYLTRFVIYRLNFYQSRFKL